MTLVEILIAALILSFVATSVYLLQLTMQNTLTRGELMSDLQQNARIGLAQMVQEITMTGYDPPAPIIPDLTPGPRAPIRAAGAQCFAFMADLKSTGTASQITYYLGGNRLYRRVENWDRVHKKFDAPSTQPLAQLVTGLSFSFYDPADQLLQPGPGTRTCPPGASQTFAQLAFDEMRLVRRIGIVLRIGDRRPGLCPAGIPPSQPCEFYTVTSDARLRNL